MCGGEPLRRLWRGVFDIYMATVQLSQVIGKHQENQTICNVEKS
jgi:hypothetical protein